MSEQIIVKTAGASGAPGKEGATAPKPAAPRPAAPRRTAAAWAKWKWILLIVLVVAAGLGYYAWTVFRPGRLPAAESIMI